MATIIRIHRSTGSSAPGSLKSGELAYSAGAGTQANGGDRLYFGKGDDGSGNATTVEVIGGAYFANLLDHVAGTLTASSAIITDASSKIDNLKVDNIDINGNTISSTDTNGNIVLDPNGNGTVDVNTSKIVNVTDPTADQDAATKKYVDDQNAVGTFTFATDSSGTYGLMLQDSTFELKGGTQIGTRRSSNTVTIDLDNSGVVAGTYGSATQIPIFSVTAQGTIDSADYRSVATTLTIAADNGSNDTVDLISDTLTFQGSTNITTNVTDNQISIVLDSDVTGLNSLTVDNLKLDGNTLSSTDASGFLYINPFPVGDSGDVVILGNLTVEGTTTTVNSTTVSLNDKNLVLADSAADSAEANGAGITINGPAASKGGPVTFQYKSATNTIEFNRPLTTPSASITNIISNYNTDNLTEGSSNLYYTDERVDDRVNSLLLAGEGIDLTYDDVANSLTVDGEDATITNKGIASFGGYADSANAPAPGNARQFSLSSGDVTIAVIDGGTY